MPSNRESRLEGQCKALLGLHCQSFLIIIKIIDISNVLMKIDLNSLALHLAMVFIV